MFHVGSWGREDIMPKNEGSGATCLPQLDMFSKEVINEGDKSMNSGMHTNKFVSITRITIPNYCSRSCLTLLHLRH